MNPPDSEGRPALIVLKAQPGDAGSRLDQWLAARLAPDFSRSRVQALIEAGAVSREGITVRQRKLKIASDDSFTVALPEPEPPEPAGENIPLDILHEDSELIVINKPPGMVVHPGAGNWSGTLVNALIHHCGDSLSGIGGVRRPGIVHRLDKDTSGVMVAAKTDRAHKALSEAFAAHGADGTLERAYLALVWGCPARDRGTIDAPLGRSSRDRTMRAVVSPRQPDARNAVTSFAVRSRFGGENGEALASLLECRLQTGRTHQIRVHMAHIGHPLIGDPDYGRGFRTKANTLPEPLRSAVLDFGRQALHAWLLAFTHPVSGQKLRFEAAPPPDMAKLLADFAAL